MNWHTRYAQQANWTRELRSYIFEKTGLRNTSHVLEVGCGTGAILSELPKGPAIHGLDINREALIECRLHAPQSRPVQGNALSLPYPDHTFGIVYSHFLLLWVGNPLGALREMKRVTKQGGYVIAFAEPDYLNRIDEPRELIPLGKGQTDSIRSQGADPGLGARLAGMFFEAGITIQETGKIQSAEQKPSLDEWKIEWEVIESDLRGSMPDERLQKMQEIDHRARQEGRRVFYVPTYFAWGQV